MDETSLITVCATAFLAVFVLLITLAAVIRVIAVVLPSRDRTDDAVLAAAISAAVGTIFPGARVSRIEEVV